MFKTGPEQARTAKARHKQSSDSFFGVRYEQGRAGSEVSVQDKCRPRTGRARTGQINAGQVCSALEKNGKARTRRIVDIKSLGR